jgi:glycerophosphoryl diester phosphodiesterase
MGRAPVRLAALAEASALAALGVTAGGLAADREDRPRTRLEARAVLPAATFAPGPPSGTLLGTGAINGIPVPFASQPVQGFSAIADNHDGTFTVQPDNGYGQMENSADFNLRQYRIRPSFETRRGGAGTIDVLGSVELRDPEHRIPFPITNEFTPERILTGADFDIESLQRAPDGASWIGDEFGPFLLHVDSAGKVLEAPFPLPDTDNPGREIRSPQNRSARSRAGCGS